MKITNTMLTAILAKEVEDELNKKVELPITFSVETSANSMTIYYKNQRFEVDMYYKVCVYDINGNQFSVRLDDADENKKVALKWLSQVIEVVAEKVKKFACIREQQNNKNTKIAEDLETQRELENSKNDKEQD